MKSERPGASTPGQFNQRPQPLIKKHPTVEKEFSMSTLLPEQAAVAATSATPDRRIVPALIDAMPVYVECPGWCTIDHVAQNMKFLEDVWHGSGGVDLSAPDGLGLVLVARLGTDPYSSKPERRGPFVAIDDGSDSVNLTPQQAEEFADSLVAFAARVRDLARSVA